MNPSSTSFSRLAFSLFATLVFQTATNRADAQTTGNLLINGSFESPQVTGINLNNIIGAGQSWGGWDCTNGGFNILHLLGSGYLSGANHADDGIQYVDVASSDGYISQSFVLDHASPLAFSGAYSNREAGWSNFVNWMARIEVLDSAGNIVGASATRNFVTADNMENWYSLAGSTSTLQPGRYTYRAYAGNSGHFDNASVIALSGQVLATKLIKFTTTEKNNQLISSWTVANEENLKGYELQGSTDGTTFRSIRFVAAKNSGNYSIVNRRPSNHCNYYRLKLVNEDGVPTYSSILTLRSAAVASVAIYPNPASSFFKITVENEMVNTTGSVIVVNAGGQVVKKQDFSKLGQTEMIEISKLIPGTYFVRLSAGENVIMKMLEIVRS